MGWNGPEYPEDEKQPIKCVSDSVTKNSTESSSVQLLRKASEFALLGEVEKAQVCLDVLRELETWRK